METILFGSTPVNVTREDLMKMPPHQRSECFALMSEQGKSDLAIGTMFGIGSQVVRRLIEAKHHYAIPKAAEERVTPEPVSDVVADRIDISRNALRLLRRIGRERQGWTAGKATISAETGVYDGALEKAMSEVLDRGLVVKLANQLGRGGRTPCYCVTPQGSALLARAAKIMAEA
ncbi:hypothetical protein [Rhizobium sp. GCM10022189]|uniref:hypothetical protein n=1 Tax=Rhizobium sp. GCM10022189 TaxID=3252654 RepID=UPI00360C1A56